MSFVTLMTSYQSKYMVLKLFNDNIKRIIKFQLNTANHTFLEAQNNSELIQSDKKIYTIYINIGL